MREKKTRMVKAFLGSLGLMLLLGGQVYAGSKHGMHGGMFGMGFRMEMIEKFSTELGLEGETLDRLKELAHQAKKESISLKADLKVLYLDLKKSMHADSPDEKQVMTLVEKIGSLEIQLKKKHVRLLLSIRKLLTPEQREKMIQLIKEHRNKHMHDRGEKQHRRRH